MATTSEDDKTPTAIKEITHKVTSKETPRPQGINQMPVSNVAKWDTL